MEKRRWTRCMIAVLCAGLLLCSVPCAEALVLRGQFPAYSGMYWNFTDSGAKQEKTWAVLGQFTRSDVGSLLILARQAEGFLALREQWDGLYLHGEYGPDGFTEPDTPVMFMPYAIDFDRPVTQSTRMRAYAPGEGGGLLETYDLRVTVSLQALEDIMFEGREIRNCAVIVKKTEKKGAEETETFWLAPGIGPVKMRSVQAGSERICELRSYRSNRGPVPREFSLGEYFPLNPGTRYEYREGGGETTVVKFGAREERLGRRTIAYAEPGGDVFYLAWTEGGLVFPLKYAASMGFALASLPPDRPQVLLPARSAPGRLNWSLGYVRPCQWPSLQPMLDFYPDNEISSVIVGVEDVTVPSGTYRDCIKLCLSSVNRSFGMQREKIRVGFLWLAPGVGEVRREGLSLANTYLDETPEYVYQAERRELVALGKFDLPKTALSPEPVPSSARRVSADDLVWLDNSQNMFDAAVDEAPFFVRMIVRGSLRDAVAQRADAEGRVTEDAVIAAVQATTPEKMRADIVRKLELMKTGGSSEPDRP